MSLVVRDEEPPDDTVVVVRGGLAAAESIRRTAEMSQAIHGFYGVSVFLAIDLTVEKLVHRTPELSPDRYKQLRTSTVGQIRQAHLDLLATADWPHYDVVLADLDEETIQRLGHCFGPPFPNPGAGAKLGGHDVGHLDRLPGTRGGRTHPDIGPLHPAGCPLGGRRLRRGRCR